MLRPFLGRLVPVLLKNMVYDEYDEEVGQVTAVACVMCSADPPHRSYVPACLASLICGNQACVATDALCCPELLATKDA